MNRKLKEMIKNHIITVKTMYPELYIEVDRHGDDILIGISSQDISNEKEYEKLMLEFMDEYDNLGFYDVYWGVNSSLKSDNLMMFKNLIKVPKKEVPKKNQKTASPKPQMRGQL